MQTLTRSTEGGAGRGRKDLGGEILKRHDFSVVLNYCFEVQSSLFVAVVTGQGSKCKYGMTCRTMTQFTLV